MDIEHVTLYGIHVDATEENRQSDSVVDVGTVNSRMSFIVSFLPRTVSMGIYESVPMISLILVT